MAGGQVLLMLGRKPADIDMDAAMKEIDEDGSEEVCPGYA